MSDNSSNLSELYLLQCKNLWKIESRFAQYSQNSFFEIFSLKFLNRILFFSLFNSLSCAIIIFFASEILKFKYFTFLLFSANHGYIVNEVDSLLFIRLCSRCSSLNLLIEGGFYCFITSKFKVSPHFASTYFIKK